MFGWNYFHGTFYLAYKEVLNVLGTALLVGLLVMMVRRARRPAKLDYARPDRAPAIRSSIGASTASATGRSSGCCS